MAERNKLLLALHTPLYAPLYLAKERSYGSFQHIDFDYRPVHSGRGDPLVRDVLSRSHDKSNCIAAVCDPFRAMLKPNESFEKAQVLGGIIRHLAYFIVDHEVEYSAEDCTKLPEVFERVVVHPPYMTGYAVMRHFIANHCNGQSDEDVLFSDTYPGFEEFHYFRLRNSFLGRSVRKQKRDFAFLTTNPMFRYTGKHEVKLSLGAMETYQNCLMTSLVVGEETAAGSADKATIEGIVEGISRAIEVIYSDPLEAAFYIRRFSGDPLVPFSFGVSRIQDLERIVIGLRDMGTYAGDCKVSSEQIRRGAEIRSVALDENPDRDYLANKDQWESFFDATFLKDTPVAQPSASASHPLWVRKIVYDYANASPLWEQAGLREKGRCLIAVAPALAGTLLALGASSLTPSSWEIGDFSPILEGSSFTLSDAILVMAAVLCFISAPFFLLFFARANKRTLPLSVEFLYVVSAVSCVTIIALCLLGREWSDDALKATAVPGAGFLFYRHRDFPRHFWRSSKLFVRQYAVYTRILFRWGPALREK